MPVHTARILLVDDYPDALLMWAFFLRTRGYHVVTATDGLAAINIAADMVPDLIVMDLMLPRISGCDAARRLRSRPRTARIPIIATTGNTHPAHLDEARTIGFVRIMIKPCDPPRMIAEIERALAARFIVSGDAATAAEPTIADREWPDEPTPGVGEPRPRW
jgi:two-component system cell cycle response regulator DivK